MAVEDLVDRARNTPGCRVRPPGGTLRVAPGARVPDDVSRFYDLCDGAELFPDTDYGVSILPAAEVRGANVVIVGRQYPDDPSAAWYTIAGYADREYLSIDFSPDPDRNGRCFDSFHEVHGIVGSMPVIASSFEELLAKLLEGEGRRWWWLTEDFAGTGDAYD